MASGRNLRVDLLRTIAIVLVVLVHFQLIANPATWHLSLMKNGYYGVTLFFVVSGFLITDGALTRYSSLSRIDVATFYRARAYRILPALIVMMAATIALSIFGTPGFASTADVTIKAILYVLALVANFAFFNGLLFPSWGPLWSLAVEETFYLAYPWLGRAFSARGVVVLLVFLVFIGPIFRSMWGVNSVFMQPGCLDAIALGCLVALVRKNCNIPIWLSATSFAAGVTLFSIAFFGAYQAQNYIAGPSLAALGAAGTTLWAASGKPGSRVASIFVLPGRLCYEIYLIHWPIAILLLNAGAFAHGYFEIVALAAFALVMIAAGLLSWLVRLTLTNMRRVRPPALNPSAT